MPVLRQMCRRPSQLLVNGKIEDALDPALHSKPAGRTPHFDIQEYYQCTSKSHARVLQNLIVHHLLSPSDLCERMPGCFPRGQHAPLAGAGDVGTAKEGPGPSTAHKTAGRQMMHEGIMTDPDRLEGLHEQGLLAGAGLLLCVVLPTSIRRRWCMAAGCGAWRPDDSLSISNDDDLRVRIRNCIFEGCLFLSLASYNWIASHMISRYDFCAWLQVVEQNGMWLCEYDGKTYPSMVRRYIPLIKCTDHTSECTVNLFNDTVPPLPDLLPFPLLPCLRPAFLLSLFYMLHTRPAPQ